MWFIGGLAGMAKKSRRSNMLHPGPIGDFGPGIVRYADGRNKAWPGAAQVVVENREDPDRPAINSRTPHLVRGARRRVAVVDLAARGTINKRQYDAIIRLLDECSIACGGGGTADLSGIPSSPTPRAGYPERQVLAITRVNAIRSLIGLKEDGVFWWVVFYDGSVRGWEDRYRVAHGEGMIQFKDMVDALDDEIEARW